MCSDECRTDECGNKLRWFAVMALVVVLVANAGVPRVRAQANVVRPEDVTTPAPQPVPLPTPTAAPVDDARQSTEPAADGYPASMYGTDVGYVVQEGDTLWTVSLEMGVDLDVMPCLVDPYHRTDRPLVVGDWLSAPSGQMYCHQVSHGETLVAVAEALHVTVDDLISDKWNMFDDGVDVFAPLEPGRYVRVAIESRTSASPGFFAYMLDRPIGEPPLLAYAVGGPVRKGEELLVPEDWPYGSGYFEWPSYGWITQGYRNDHRALDIAAPLGTAVTAADRGVVVRAGWNNQGYGNFVIIDHNIDYVTLYSHLNEIYVREGDIVAKGQVLGTVGSTGNSTGPHLHFEVRDFGSRINPLEVLVR